VKFRGYGSVVASTYLGEVEAKDIEEARKKFERAAYVSVCHHCSAHISDPEVHDIQIERVES
jgi:hypothetical protein